MAADPRMICPRCRSAVVPLQQASGELLCPACRNTGVVENPQAVQWGTGQAAGYARPAENAPGAVASLVLGIVSFLPYVGIVTGWIAIYLGNSALRAIKASPGRYDGAGMAQAGRILGIVALCIYLVVVAVVIVAAIVFVLVSNLSKNGP
ncbi:MAG: DUF4190 domain-containing protein [Halobacteriales archaeon]|nr:DUF4190 domain-containing protein [Halobacteriales archaeon]